MTGVSLLSAGRIFEVKYSDSLRNTNTRTINLYRCVTTLAIKLEKIFGSFSIGIVRTYLRCVPRENCYEYGLLTIWTRQLFSPRYDDFTHIFYGFTFAVWKEKFLIANN